MAHPNRSVPPTPTAGALRAAADLVGVSHLAKQFNIKERTLYVWMQGKRTPPDTILTELREILVEHRQKISTLIQATRAVDAGEFEDLGQEVQP